MYVLAITVRVALPDELGNPRPRHPRHRRISLLHLRGGARAVAAALPEDTDYLREVGVGGNWTATPISPPRSASAFPTESTRF